MSKRNQMRAITRAGEKMDEFRERHKMKGTTCPSIKPEYVEEADKKHKYLSRTGWKQK